MVDGPDTRLRAAMVDLARDDVVQAHAELIEQIHDVDFHHYSDGGMEWLYRDHSLEAVAEQVLDLADQVHQAAATARAAIAAAMARRAWLASGGLLRCLGCGEAIEATWNAWQVCRGLPEHDTCHDDDQAVEDTDRAFTLAEDVHDAYCEHRMRTGGPRDGDLVEVTGPDGHIVEAVWVTGPDGHPIGRADTHEATPVDLGLATATGVQVVELAADRTAGDEYAAYCEARTRDGGPQAGDLVEVTYLDGHTIRAVWETGPDRGGRPGTVHLVPRPDGLDRVVTVTPDPGAPAPAEPVRVEVLALAQDVPGILHDLALAEQWSPAPAAPEQQQGER